MIPKTKAILMYLKYERRIQNKNISKSCALSEVDDMLHTIPMPNRNFLKEVKQELEKL
jgi:hypothetical protein